MYFMSGQKFRSNLFFNRWKLERNYFNDSIKVNSGLIPIVLFNFLTIFHYGVFNNGSSLIPLKVIGFLILTAFLMKYKGNIYSRFILGNLLLLWTIYETIHYLENDLIFVFVFFLNFLNSYCSTTIWYFNLAQSIVNFIFIWFCLNLFKSHLTFSLQITILFIIFNLTILFLDYKNRAFWIRFTDLQRKVRTYEEMLNNFDMPVLIVDHNKKILFKNNKSDALTKKLSKQNEEIINFAKKTQMKIFDEQFMVSKMEHSAKFSFTLTQNEIPSFAQQKTTTSEYILEIMNIKQKMKKSEKKDDSTNNALLNTMSNISAESLLKKIKKSNQDEIRTNVQIQPIFWNRKLAYILQFQNDSLIHMLLNKISESLKIIHMNSFKLLLNLEADFVKWANLQKISNIKEYDLKSLGNCIFDKNVVVGELYLLSEIMNMKEDEDPEEKKNNLNLHNLIISILELIFLKANEMQHEVTLFLENMFPEQVSGDYFLFRHVFFSFLELIILNSAFPKFSKFRLNCKFERVDPSQALILKFELEFPKRDHFKSYVQTLFFSSPTLLPLLFDRNFDISLNFEIFLPFLLQKLGTVIYFLEEQENDCLILQIPLWPVEIKTIIPSPSKISPITSGLKYDARGVFLSTPIDVSFCRTKTKKGTFVWKNKNSGGFKYEKANNAQMIKNNFISNEENIKKNMNLEKEKEKEKEKEVKERKSIIERKKSKQTEKEDFRIQPEPTSDTLEEETNEKLDHCLKDLKGKINEIMLENSLKIKTTLKQNLLCLMKEHLESKSNKKNHRFLSSIGSSQKKIDNDIKSMTFSGIKEQQKMNWQNYQHLINRFSEMEKNLYEMKGIENLEFKNKYLSCPGKDELLIHKTKSRTSSRKETRNSCQLVDALIISKNRFPQSSPVSKPKKPLLDKGFHLETFPIATEKSIIIDKSELKGKNPILPFDNDVPNGLLSRLENQKRTWAVKNVNSPDKRRVKRIRHNDKLSVLIIDGRLSNLIEYQKLTFSSNLDINFADNWEKGWEMFQNEEVEGNIFDFVVADINLKAEIISKSLRDFEKKNSVKPCFLLGICNDMNSQKKESFLQMSFDSVESIVTEGLLKEIINSLTEVRKTQESIKI